MRLLELWIDKALISYQGEWLESSRDFLYNFLVGNTQAVTWSLDCCYSSNKELAHSHFLVLSRLLASHSVSNCPPEEAMLVALYMLGDPAQHIRQRAAQLLSFALARASRAHPGHQSLPEVSGTEYLNPLRLDALQLRASEKSADFAAAFCVGGMQAKTMSALFARVILHHGGGTESSIIVLVGQHCADITHTRPGSHRIACRARKASTLRRKSPTPGTSPEKHPTKVYLV